MAGTKPGHYTLRDLNRRPPLNGRAPYPALPSRIARVIDDLTAQSRIGDLRVHCRTGRVD